VVRYRSFVQADNDNREVRLTNLGQNGWQSSDLISALRNDANFRSAVSSADVVTFDIGGNDLLHALDLFWQGTCGGADNQDCMRSTVANFIPNWDAIVQEILSLRDKDRTIIRTMDVYNPFVGQLMVSGTFPIVKGYLDQVDAHIASSAAANGIPMARVYQAFNGPNGDEDPVMKGYMSIDGIHPNDAGHKVIADLLRDLGYAPLK
jgi:lysophospholipase L1-like esterase